MSRAKARPAWQLSTELWLRILRLSATPPKEGDRLSPEACLEHLHTLAGLMGTCKTLRRLVTSYLARTAWQQVLALLPASCCSSEPAFTATSCSVQAVLDCRFRWHAWRVFSKRRCTALARWLLPRAVHVTHLDLGLKSVHDDVLTLLLGRLVSLRSLSVHSLGANSATLLGRGLQASRAPLVELDCSGGLPSWLPSSLTSLTLRLSHLRERRDKLDALPERLLARCSQLRKLQLDLAGWDPFTGDGDSDTVCCAACHFWDAPDLNRLTALRELSISQELVDEDWLDTGPEQIDEYAAMRYLLAMQDRASYSLHGLQMRTHLLPQLTSFKLSLGMAICVERLQETSDSDDELEGYEQYALSAVSTYQLLHDGCFRQITSSRHLEWSAVAPENRLPSEVDEKCSSAGSRAA